MLELKLRGYVTPEDFEGSDGERIQKALDTAKSEDIAKVVLMGSYKSDIPITIPARSMLKMIASFIIKTSSGWSFIYLLAKNPFSLHGK